MSTHERHLAAILFTDIVGYTAMMQKDESKAVSVIKHYNEVLDNSVKAYRGEVLNNYGDGSLCSFPSALEALTCAIQIQAKLQSDPVVPLRIGLHVGEIFFENGKVLGDGVNVASRIQSLGVANSILLSDELYKKVKNQPEFKVTALGTFRFKNVDEKVDVYALSNEGLIVPNKSKLEGKVESKGSYSKKWLIFFALLLTISGYFLYQQVGKKEEVLDRSIAVLPFVNMSNDPNQEYFSDGLSEELLNLLSKVPEMKVIGRTSSFSFKGKNEDLRSIAKKLGVAHILEGSVRKSGNKVRITAQLISAVDGTHLWSKTYDRDLDDIFKVQDEIASAVINELKATLLITNPRQVTQNSEAYNKYLEGKYFAGRGGLENYSLALQKFEQVLAMDSSFAAAWVGISNVYINQASGGYIPVKDGFGRAHLAVQNALKIDPMLSEAYSVQSRIYMSYDWDWTKARASIERAIELDPGNASNLSIIGALSLRLGLIDEAIERFKQSIAIDPLRMATYNNMAFALLSMSNFEEAEITIHKLQELNPSFPSSNYLLARVQLGQGNYEAALASIQKESNEGWRLAGLPLVYFKLNQIDKAESTLKEYINKYGDVWAYQISEAFAFKGDIDMAFHWLERAYEQRDSGLTNMKIAPYLASLHDDVRWRPFLSKIGLD